MSSARASGSPPPRLWERILALALHADDRDDVLSDLREEYRSIQQHEGERTARRWYRWQVRRSLLPVVRRRLRTWKPLREPSARTAEPSAVVRFGGWMQDARFAVRSAMRAPFFFASAAVILTVGIAANTSIFAVVKTLFLDPLPYPQGTELVRVTSWNDGQGRITTMSPADFIDYREMSTHLADIAAYNFSYPTMTGSGDPVRLAGAVVSQNFFSVLRTPPAIGRTLSGSGATRGEQSVAVIAHSLWITRFGGSASVIGSSIELDGVGHEIVGVMPSGFVHPEPRRADPIQIWAPLDASDVRRASRFLYGVGRLAEGSTIEDARIELEAIAARLEQEYPESNTGKSASVVRLRDEMYGENSATVGTLAVAAALLMLMISANLASLLIVRSHARRREFAVRSALGAGNGRIARLVLMESAFVALTGGVAGLGVVAAGIRMIDRIQAVHLRSPVSVELDGAVVVFVLVLALLVMLIFGTGPALLSSRGNLANAIREGATGAGGGRSLKKSGDALVIAEIALASALLVVGALLTRSFSEQMKTATGFEPEGLLTFDLSLQREDSSQLPAEFGRIKEAVSAVPGVVAVDFVSDLPFTSSNRSSYILPEGVEYGVGEFPSSEYHTVWSSDFFLVLGIQLLEGRLFDEADRRSRSRIAVVNRSMAERYWPDGDVIGSRFRTTLGGSPVTVVGIVDDVLDDGYRSRPGDRAYYPFWINPNRSMNATVRTSVPPFSVYPAVERAVWSVDPNLPLSSVRTMEELVGASVARERMAMLFVNLFSLAALFLSAFGLYGVTSYAVQQRRREFGLRTALGATPSRIRREVVLAIGGRAVVGLVLGSVIGLALAGSMKGLLYGVSAADPLALLFAVTVLGATSLLAALVPASRAATVDPVVTLKEVS